MKPLLCRYVLACFIFFISTLILQQRAEAFPVGVFLEINPSSNSDISFMTNYATTLFGPATDTGCATGVSPCKGGITGIFLKVSWDQFDKVSAGGTHTISHDGFGNVAGFLTALATLESKSGCNCTLQLSFGLAAGSSASFKALDVYALSNGGTSTSYTLPTDLACTNTDGSYDTFTTLHTGSGGNFPIQCVLDGPKNKCLQQPRVWGTDTNSVTANGWYRAAYIAAVESLAIQIQAAHAVTLVKLSGINASDVEIGIDGNPNVTQDGSGPGWCGNTSSTDAERIWTDQAVNYGTSATDIYDTTVMENTWVSLTSTLVSYLSASPYNVSSFALDLYDENNLPPVYPPHCSDQSTSSTNWCAYNNSIDIPLLTTGENEYMAKLIISNTSLSYANLGLDIASLGYGSPSNTDPNYATNEIPCAMQSVYHTPIGYQSLSSQSPGSPTLANYLAGLSNAGSYGAQFIEVSPLELSAYITMETGPFAPSPGAVELDLSLTFYNLNSAMVSNSTNNATTTLCPAPSGGGGFSTFY